MHQDPGDLDLEPQDPTGLEAVVLCPAGPDPLALELAFLDSVASDSVDPEPKSPVK